MTPQITNTYIIIKKGFQTNYGITLHRYRSLSFHHDKEPLDLSSSIFFCTIWYSCTANEHHKHSANVELTSHAIRTTYV